MRLNWPKQLGSLDRKTCALDSFRFFSVLFASKAKFSGTR